jgi:hypothetical protein
MISPSTSTSPSTSWVQSLGPQPLRNNFSTVEMANSLPDISEIFDGDDGDDNDDDDFIEEMEQEVQTRKRKSTKPKAVRKATYVKGGPKTKTYKIAQFLLKQYQLIPATKLDEYLTAQCIKGKLDRKMIANVAVSFQNVAKDLSILDDETAQDIAKECFQAQSDPMFANFLMEVDQGNIYQLNILKKSLSDEIDILHKKIRFVEYLEHTKSDLKNDAQVLTEAMFRIVSRNTI